MTLTEFLLTCIAKDEAMAQEALTLTSICGQSTVKWHWVVPLPCVLVDCKAKRRIVLDARRAINLSDATADDDGPASDRIHGAATAYECVLDQMLLPYADHPDYRDEWRP